MKTVFLAGGTGMLGTSLSKHLKKSGFNTLIQGHKQKADFNIDMKDLHSFRRILDEVNPDIIINLICLSDVDECERNKQLSYDLNVAPVDTISHWIDSSQQAQERKKIKFIQISTDHVYCQDKLNKEEDTVIINNYADSKFNAEQIALKSDGLILRTNFFGKSMVPRRNSFTDWLDKNIAEKNFPINLFKDVFFSPLSLDSLSYFIIHAINNFHPGIYNLGSKVSHYEKGCSKADFALEYSDYLKKNIENINLISVDEMNFKAKRPNGMMMDVSKFEKSFKINLPTLSSEIELFNSTKGHEI